MILAGDWGDPNAGNTIGLMDHSLAVVWHWWIAFPLVAGAALAILALIAGYLVKVVGARPPRADR